MVVFHSLLLLGATRLPLTPYKSVGYKVGVYSLLELTNRYISTS